MGTRVDELAFDASAFVTGSTFTEGAGAVIGFNTALAPESDRGDQD